MWYAYERRWLPILNKGQMAGPLPEFDNPPVSEVVLGIEFAPLENWRGPYAGLYWGTIQKEYPDTEVHPPLPSQVEKFGDEASQLRPAVRVEITANPDISRFWFVSSDKTRIVQVQRDRFIINWRKVADNEVYPRYLDTMRPRLEREWKGFKEFIAKQGIGTISVRQCEVTYVNDILEGEDWKTFPESLRLFSWWGKVAEGFLPEAEQVSCSGQFVIPDGRGRLHFVSQPAIRISDQRKVNQLRLTARGAPGANSDADLLRWMDLGREWVVRGFADLTSPAAHELWKRRKPG